MCLVREDCRMICVGIVEPDVHLRGAMAELCAGQMDIQCLFSVGSPRDLRTPSEPLPPPGVLLLGVGQARSDAAQDVRLLHDLFPAAAVVAISDEADFHLLFDLLSAGACGVLLRGAPVPDLCGAVREAAGGGAPMSPQIARAVVGFFHHRGADFSGMLTPRERDIVSGLLEGLTYKQVGARLNITLETVRSHIKSIYQKLHVHGKVELISRSLRGGS